jgi:hypothetical protein
LLSSIIDDPAKRRNQALVRRDVGIAKPLTERSVAHTYAGNRFPQIDLEPTVGHGHTLQISLSRYPRHRQCRGTVNDMGVDKGNDVGGGGSTSHKVGFVTQHAPVRVHADGDSKNGAWRMCPRARGWCKLPIWRYHAVKVDCFRHCGGHQVEDRRFLGGRHRSPRGN